MTTTSTYLLGLRLAPNLQDMKRQLGLLPQPVAYVLAAAAAIVLVILALKLFRKVVGKIIGIIVSLVMSVGLKLFLADPGFHTWLTSLAR